MLLAWPSTIRYASHDCARRRHVEIRTGSGGMVALDSEPNVVACALPVLLELVENRVRVESISINYAIIASIHDYMTDELGFLLNALMR